MRRIGMGSGIKKWGKLLCVMLLGVAVLAGCVAGSEQEKEMLTKAKGGDAESQYQLARIYFEGNGVDQSDKKGAYWVRRAADQGHMMAQGDLGMMYSLGVMVRRDNVEAVKWLTLCSEQGYGIGTRFMKDLEETMKPEDVQKGKQLAAAWKPKKE